MSSKAMTASRSLLPRWLQSLPAKEAIAGFLFLLPWQPRRTQGCVGK
jgi:hypothetical protein